MFGTSFLPLSRLRHHSSIFGFGKSRFGYSGWLGRFALEHRVLGPRAGADRPLWLMLRLRVISCGNLGAFLRRYRVFDFNEPASVAKPCQACRQRHNQISRSSGYSISGPVVSARVRIRLRKQRNLKLRETRHDSFTNSRLVYIDCCMTHSTRSSIVTTKNTVLFSPKRAVTVSNVASGFVHLYHLDIRSKVHIQHAATPIRSTG